MRDRNGNKCNRIALLTEQRDERQRRVEEMHDECCRLATKIEEKDKRIAELEAENAELRKQKPKLRKRPLSERPICKRCRILLGAEDRVLAVGVYTQMDGFNMNRVNLELPTWWAELPEVE